MNEFHDDDPGVGWGPFFWGLVMIAFWIGLFIWWLWS
jgi:hypothetical protein